MNDITASLMVISPLLDENENCKNMNRLVIWLRRFTKANHIEGAGDLYMVGIQFSVTTYSIKYYNMTHDPLSTQAGKNPLIQRDYRPNDKS